MGCAGGVHQGRAQGWRAAAAVWAGVCSALIPDRFGLASVAGERYCSLRAHRMGACASRSDAQDVLAVAAFRGDLALAQHALDSGASINMPGRDKARAPLPPHRSVSSAAPLRERAIRCRRTARRPPAPRLPPPSTTPQDGWTALHWCTYGNHVELVRLLLDNGADPLVRTKARAAPNSTHHHQPPLPVTSASRARGLTAPPRVTSSRSSSRRLPPPPTSAPPRAAPRRPLPATPSQARVHQ